MTRRIDAITLAIVVTATVLLALYGPIPQPEHYHDFADQTRWLGVPNGFDVLSNLGFLCVGLYGTHLLWGRRNVRALSPGWYGYLLMTMALTLTAAGSAYYHWAPDDARLVWDRLPISLLCAGLLAGVSAESFAKVDSVRVAIALAITAVATVAWWWVSKTMGMEDLRPYLLMQGLALLLVPLWQAGARAAVGLRWWFAGGLLFYALAKVAELNDHALYAMTGGFSGHTLKHLLATVAAAMLVAGLRRKYRARPATQDMSAVDRKNHAKPRQWNRRSA